MRSITQRQWLALLATLFASAAWLLGAARADAPGVFPVPQHAAWQEECGACHLAFAPGMLPARSWRAVMAQLREHFGADASLDAVLQRSITDFLTANAADADGAGFTLQRIARSIPPERMPLRITQTPMFEYFHEEIAAGIWQREPIGTPANCPACHTRAEEGRYPDWEVRIPKR